MSFDNEKFWLRVYAVNDIENNAQLKRHLREARTNPSYGKPSKEDGSVIEFHSFCAGLIAGKIFRNREAFLQDYEYCLNKFQQITLDHSYYQD